MDSRGGLLGGGLLAALFLGKPWDELKARRLLSTYVLGLRLGPAQAPVSSSGKWREGGIPTPSHWALPLRAYPCPLEDLPKASRPWDLQEEGNTS